MRLSGEEEVNFGDPGVPDQTSTDYLIRTNSAEKTVAGALILSLPSANRRIQLSIGPVSFFVID